MKKYYFIVSGIIQIVLAVIMLLHAPDIATGLVSIIDDAIDITTSDVSSNYKDENILFDDNYSPENEIEESDFSYLAVETIGDMKDFYTRFLQVISIFCILSAIITIKIAVKYELLFHKVTVIVLSSFLILFSFSALIMLIGVLNTIIISLSKPNEKDRLPEPKTKVEKIQYEQNNKENLIKGLLTIAVYTILYAVIPKFVLNLVPDLPQIFQLIFLEIVPAIVVFILVVLLNKDELKTGLEALKQNRRGYKYLIIKTFIATILLVAVANLIRIVIIKEIPQNQIDLFKVPFAFIAPLAIFWAPIVEECVFRGSLKKIIPNQYLFIIVSGVIFGALHAISEDGLFNIAITTIPYSIMGISFAMVYNKTNNIWTDIFVHSINNIIAIVAMYMLIGV